MRRNYHDSLNRDLAKALGRSESSISARAITLGLKKDRDFLLFWSSRTRFRKGHVPVNKGKKRPYNANSARTQFKPGQLSHTAVPVGTETRDKDGYLKRKVSDIRGVPSRKNWRFVHRLLWESHHGKIPDGHMVIFKNGDRSDIRIENLECISLKKNIERNKNRYPAELLNLSRLIGAVNRQINKREKENG